MENNNQLDLAKRIAYQYHQGQVDKAGKDYINHPLAVSEKLNKENEKIVALLHDTIEDTNLTLKDLESFGFESEIIEAIDAITRKPNEDYFAFIYRVKENHLARKVKIADLLHNLDISRLSFIDDEMLTRYQKYLKALEILILR